jgi:hypothetical protein
MIKLIVNARSTNNDPKVLVRMAQDASGDMTNGPRFRRIHYNLIRAKHGKGEANRIYHDPVR